MGRRDASSSRQRTSIRTSESGKNKQSPRSDSRRSSFEALEQRRLLCAALHPEGQHEEELNFSSLGPTASASVANPTVQTLRASRAAADRMWQPLSAIPAARGKTSYFQLNAYTPFAIDAARLQATLARAPMEFTAEGRNNPLVMTLPMPNGTLARFAVQESPILSPQDSALFPGITTYIAQGIDDPAATARLDFTYQGFHAQVLTPNGSFYIDPYFHLDQSAYVSYYRKDAYSTRHFTEGQPAEHDHEHEEEQHTDGGQEAVVGAELRTYRTAIGVTGEYTGFHGGTVPGGLSAVTTSVNRLTGVYETDFTVRMVLIANQSSLIFTNPATDPYTSPSSPSTSNTQNQTYMDANIGNANYDIGHVYHRGSDNGLAGAIGNVGVTGQKAKGYTSHSVPMNDPFTIDYVAHEMGHQYGGRHNFSNCSGGAGDSAIFAVEPGSGSSIMSYAGICGGNNLQANSDAMFNSINFDQIVAYTTNPGSPGYIAALKTATGNTPPTVEAGANFIIPVRTPYELRAVGFDADGDTLSYSWEQRDGASGTPVNNFTGFGGPVVRPWLPSSSAVRTVPRLSNLVNNTNAFGEVLTQVQRTMSFTVQVRDNRAGGGGSTTDNMVVSTINVGTTGFSVTNPNSGGSFPGGSNLNVTWNVASTNLAPINTADVAIKLSTDGGFTYPITLLSSTTNDGAADVQLPFDLGTTAARIRVEAVGNIYFDISNANFTITNVPGNPQVSNSQFAFDGVTLPAPPHRLSYTFNQPGVTPSVDISDLVLTHNGSPVSQANFLVSSDVPTNTSTFTFPGFADGVLADGQYEARLLASGVSNGTGQHLPADHVSNFFVFAGDANHDGTVNLTDFNILAANFGQSGRIFSQGDFNYDGTVNLIDFNLLASRFGTSMGPDGAIERTSNDPLPSLPFATRGGGSSLLSGKFGGSTDDEQEGLV